MKIKRVELQNFKKFKDKKKFEFNTESYNGNGSTTTLIVGNNGTGKTSLLQAIVLTTASASKSSSEFSGKTFDWPGFDYRHIQTGELPCNIQCTYEFSEDERQAVLDYSHELSKKNKQEFPLAPPTNLEEIELKYDYPNDKIVRTTDDIINHYFQFQGYRYAKKLAKYSSNKNRLFDRVGDIYWYTEQRTSYSISNLLETDSQQLDWMRSFLSSAYAFHVAVTDGNRQLSEGEFDFYDELHNLYKKVFPGRSFIGAAPNFDVFEKAQAPDFFLSDGKNQYEISEMSAGERAIFPILLDFARWNINNSIIIIDEIELHLHPPLQQTFVKALNKLGNNNQFIITSHSESVANMFEEEFIIRM